MKTVSVFFCLACLVGCSQAITTKPVERLKLNLAPVPPAQLKPVGFHVVTPENLSVVTESFVCMDMNAYRNLAINIEALKNFILMQNKQLQTYKNYYEKE